MINKKNIAIIIFSALLLAPFAFIVYTYTWSSAVLQNMGPVVQPIPTRIYDRNGTLISMLYDEYREYASINEIPEAVKKAFLSAKTASFIENHIPYQGDSTYPFRLRSTSKPARSLSVLVMSLLFPSPF